VNANSPASREVLVSEQTDGVADGTAALCKNGITASGWHCTGSAHVGSILIRCTDPSHDVSSTLVVNQRPTFAELLSDPTQQLDTEGVVLQAVLKEKERDRLRSEGWRACVEHLQGRYNRRADERPAEVPYVMLDGEDLWFLPREPPQPLPWPRRPARSVVMTAHTPDGGGPKFFPEVSEHGMSWRDGLDFLDRALDDCAQAGDDDPHAAIRVAVVREIVQAIRRYEDDTDESIRSALWEDAVTEGDLRAGVRDA
jgi:hypothetical protein